jgi:hypothetical protein
VLPNFQRARSLFSIGPNRPAMVKNGYILRLALRTRFVRRLCHWQMPRFGVTASQRGPRPSMDGQGSVIMTASCTCLPRLATEADDLWPKFSAHYSFTQVFRALPLDRTTRPRVRSDESASARSASWACALNRYPGFLVMNDIIWIPGESK